MLFTKVVLIWSWWIFNDATAAKSCVLRDTSKYPWLVIIHEPYTASLGALMSADKVLSTCNAFAQLNPDLDGQKYEIIIRDNGADKSSCNDSRLAVSIMVHPKCNPLDELQLHDFAMWTLRTPFEVSGKPFLTSLLLDDEHLRTKISNTELNESCLSILTKLSLDQRVISPVEEIVGKCTFKSQSTLDLCNGNNCFIRGDGLLCFYHMAGSEVEWVVRHPWETPEQTEGSVVSCNGTPIGMASRAFYKDQFRVYRMFSNFIGNLGIFNFSYNIPVTTPVVSSSTTAVTPSPTTAEDAGRSLETISTTESDTFKNCSCPQVGSFQDFDGQTSVHGELLWHTIIVTVWLQLPSFLLQLQS